MFLVSEETNAASTYMELILNSDHILKCNSDRPITWKSDSVASLNFTTTSTQIAEFETIYESNLYIQNISNYHVGWYICMDKLNNHLKSVYIFINGIKLFIY